MSVEIIKKGKSVLAIIVRGDIKEKGVKFFTPHDYPFQIGFHNRKKGIILKPHYHPIQNFNIKSSQEVLYVLLGSIKVDLYGINNKIFKSIILQTGDSILFVSGGHGVKFLKNSKVFEVKQGPYFGDKKAKIFI